MWKAYLDKGMALTYYLKYGIALFGISSLNVKLTMIIGLVWIFCSFFIGWLWYALKIIDTENEIQNIFNPFQREVRHAIKKRKI